MLEDAALNDLLHTPELGRKDKLLLVLATNGASPRSVKQIRETAVSHGLRQAKKWNISDILSYGQTYAIRTVAGWELNSAGRQRVRILTGSPGIAADAAVDLRAHLARIGKVEVLTFVGEAISCLEVGALRAAVVLAWVGAVAVLYGYVVDKTLAEFNAEAKRRDAKWKAAATTDDLARMKEHDFLEVLEAISVIGKNVKQDLQGSLKLRNACGHPSSLQIGERKASAHIETLILNVFTRF